MRAPLEPPPPADYFLFHSQFDSLRANTGRHVPTPVAHMVRKKRRALLKEAAAGDAATATASSFSSSVNSAQPPRVPLERVVAHAPEDTPLPFALATGDAADAPALDSLAAWLAHLSAAPTLFEQLRVLQLFRSKVSKAPANPPAFTAAAWRLLFRVYVSPLAASLRKNVFLVLDALVRNDATAAAAAAPSGPLRAAVGDELQSFVAHLGRENAAPATPEQSVQALDLLLLLVEFPFVARVLVSDSNDADSNDTVLQQFVRFCADHLAFLAEPIVDFSISGHTSSSATASTNVVVLASERCGHALKNSILLCALKDVLYARVRQLSTRLGSAVATRDFLRLLGHCVLLLQTTVAPKDLLTQAGLAYCVVLRLVLEVSATATAHASTLLLQTMYPDRTLVSATALASAVTSPLLHVHVTSDVASFGAFARLAVYRGLLSGLSDDELVQPFNDADNSDSDR